MVPCASPQGAGGHSWRFSASSPLPQGGDSWFPEPPWGSRGLHDKDGHALPGVINSKGGTRRQVQERTKPPPSRNRRFVGSWRSVPNRMGGSRCSGVTKLQQDTEAERQGHNPPSHMHTEHPKACGLKPGSELPSLPAWGASNPSLRKGQGGSLRGERAQLPARHQAEHRRGESSNRARRASPGDGAPLSTRRRKAEGRHLPAS